jgi:hypothetical protein
MIADLRSFGSLYFKYKICPHYLFTYQQVVVPYRQETPVERFRKGSAFAAGNFVLQSQKNTKR